MDKEEFEFNQSEKIKDKTRLNLKFQKSKKIEEHHPIGKANSKATIPFCLHCHDFITSRQNTLSRNQRKNKLRFAIESIASLLELCVKFLRAIAWRL